MEQEAPPSMKDIARAAGVSQPTVSRALRNHPSISAETCERIRAVAESLGYRPNPMVTTLMADLKARRRPSSTSTLAFVTAFPEREGWRYHQTFGDFFEGAEARAASLGYVLERFWLKEPGMTSERFSRMLYTRGIPGIIVPPLPRPYGHLSLDWDRFAAAAIGYTLVKPDLSKAATHHSEGMHLAMRRLRRLGYRRIGFAVTADTSKRVHDGWLSGYLMYQFRLPKKERIPPCVASVNKVSLPPEVLAKWYREHKPDCVIGGHNEVMQEFQEAGMDIPDKVGFASLSTGWLKDQPAGINHHPRIIGAAAADIVTSQIHRNERGIPEHPKLTLIPGSWVDGPTVRRLV